MILSLAMILLAAPVLYSLADDQTQGDDLIETVFKGIVTDIETGGPLKGVSIYGFDENYNEWKSDFTDEDGKYYLEFSRGGTYYIYAEHSEYYQVEIKEEVEINTETTLDINMEPKVFDTLIYGYITDYMTGEPIEGAVVALMEVVYSSDGGGWTGESIEYYYTEEDGSYSFDAFQGNFSVWAGKQGYNDDYEDPFFVRGGSEYRVDISLIAWDEGVFGRVTDDDGDPVQGVYVSIHNDYTYDLSVTDEDGNYKIWVPAPGEFTLEVREDGYMPYVETIVIEEDEMLEHDIMIEESQLPLPILRLVYVILSLLGGI